MLFSRGPRAPPPEPHHHFFRAKFVAKFFWQKNYFLVMLNMIAGVAFNNDGAWLG